MGANPRIVAAETWIQWDGVSQRLPKGQTMDVVPGSALERAIGAGNLVPLGAVAAQPPARAEEEPEGEAEPKAEEPPAATPKPRAAAKKQDDDGKDGDS